MSWAASSLLLATYYLVLGLLALYGLHRLWLTALYYRHRRQGPMRPDDPHDWPKVTVQLPLFNEMYVAARLIDAVCRLDYPAERLQIQVLDDSDDETREIVGERVVFHRRQGLKIEHLHRERRQGYKAGALAAGLECAEGELVAIFDADFLPPRHFLRRTVPFFADPDLGMVQACWDHLNRRYSLLTQVQAILLDAHFLIEHLARNRSGAFFNFNGTAGLWRRRAITDAGGWTQETLTEDLDLSYRAQLAGWKFLFLPELRVEAELPVDVSGFKSQQFRWAKGSIQTGRKLLPGILRAAISGRQKLEAFIHLTSNLSYPLMVALSLLVFPAMLVRRGGDPWLLALIDLPLFLGATLSVLAFYATSQLARGGAWRRELMFLPALMGLGVGLAINNSRAVIQGLFAGGGVFERTPKYGIGKHRVAWSSKRYRVNRGFGALVEGLLALYFAACFVWASRSGMWLSLPFLYLFLHGYCYIFLLTLFSGARRGRRRSRLSEVLRPGVARG